MKVHCIINGTKYELEINPSMRLIDILRRQLGLTGTKEGCGAGECGACTVIVNKKAVNSCLMMGSQMNNAEIITVEGLEKNGEYDILQRKFVEHGAIQCGYCTSGMLMSAKALLMSNPNPSLDEIKRALEGNLCRCTGYNKIADAVLDAAQQGQENNGQAQIQMLMGDREVKGI